MRITIVTKASEPPPPDFLDLLQSFHQEEHFRYHLVVYSDSEYPDIGNYTYLRHYVVPNITILSCLHLAIDENVFDSDFFVWMEIELLCLSKKNIWAKMLQDLKLVFASVPDKIHLAIRAPPEPKLSTDTWVDYVSNLGPSTILADLRLFGGNKTSMSEFILLFQRQETLQRQTNILIGERKHLFRLWYSDQEGLLQNIFSTKTSFENASRHIQWHLDQFQYQEACDILDTVEPDDSVLEWARFTGLRLQVDYYLLEGLFSDSLFSILSELPESFFRTNLNNLCFYHKDQRLIPLLLKNLSKSSWDEWNDLDENYILMDEAPFPSDEKHLLNEFRNQFLRSDAQDVVQRMYQILETPTSSSSSLFFVWPRLVSNPSKISHLSCFLKRNYPEVKFRILFLTETEREDEDGLLPFRYVQLKDDTITCKNWIDVLLKNKKNFI